MLEKLEADLDNENPWERVVTLVRNTFPRLHTTARCSTDVRLWLQVDVAKEVKEDEGSDVSRMRSIK